ncbi:MAG: MFS transporter [Alphaproteobacteria bacterium]|nr:MFS transporter [Alphaproteobacteria bacterium]
MHTPPRASGGLAALGVLALCFLMNALARGVGETYAVFLLPIGGETGWDRGALTSVYSIYMAATGLASPFVGLAFDRFGPRVLYLFGLLSLGGGFALASGMTHLWQLYLSVGLMGGLGIAALGMIPASALISRWFDVRLASAMAVASAGLGTGTLALAPVAQLLVEHQGWREAYVFLGGGVLLLAVPTALLPWRRIEKGRVAHQTIQPVSGSIGRGGPMLAQAIRTRPFWALFGVYFFTAVGVFAVSLQSVAYLVEHGFAPLQAAGAFGFTGMLSIVGMLVTGAAADRYGNRITATISYLCTLTGIAALFLVQAVPGFALVVVFVLFFGVSMGARGPIVSTVSATLFAGRGMGAIFGTIATGQGLGAALGSWLAGRLHDATGGYDVGFLMSSGFVLVAITLFWTVPELKARRERHA